MLVMRRLSLACILACVLSGSLLAQSGLSDLLTARLDAYQQRLRANDVEGRQLEAADRELQAAKVRAAAERNALAARCKELEQELRDELMPPPPDDTALNCRTLQFEPKPPKPSPTPGQE